MKKIASSEATVKGASWIKFSVKYIIEYSFGQVVVL